MRVYYVDQVRTSGTLKRKPVQSFRPPLILVLIRRGQEIIDLILCERGSVDDCRFGSRRRKAVARKIETSPHLVE
jgi:hypothetical protein